MGRTKQIEPEVTLLPKKIPVVKGGRKPIKAVPPVVYEIIISITEDDYEISESGTPPKDFDSETFFDDVEELLSAE